MGNRGVVSHTSWAIGDLRGGHLESEFAMHYGSSGTSKNVKKTFFVLATI